MAVLKGENRVILNRATMQEIVQDWLNNRAPNDPDVDVTDVYEESSPPGFTVVVREREVAKNG